MSYKNGADNIALRKRAVYLCIATTAAVCLTEIAIGLMFELVSIFAEGLHTGADLLDSFMALLLITLASRPADRSHPYGHGKYDTLAGFIEGAGVGIAGLWTGYVAIQVLLGLKPADPRPENVTVVAMVLAGVLYWVVSRHILVLAVRTQSPTVRAEGLHLRLHVYTSIALVAGLLLSKLAIAAQWEYAKKVDPAVALLLGLYLLKMSYQIIKPSFEQFMDTALPQEEREAMLECVAEFSDRFVEVHGVRTRRSGMDRHVDIHLMVPPQTTVQDGHDLSHEIEQRMTERWPGTRLLVHVEPAHQAAMEGYRTRGKRGIIRDTESHPGDGESSHHDLDSAHEA